MKIVNEKLILNSDTGETFKLNDFVSICCGRSFIVGTISEINDKSVEIELECLTSIEIESEDIDSIKSAY